MKRHGSFITHNHSYQMLISPSVYFLKMHRGIMVVLPDQSFFSPGEVEQFWKTSIISSDLYVFGQILSTSLISFLCSLMIRSGPIHYSMWKKIDVHYLLKKQNLYVILVNYIRIYDLTCSAIVYFIKSTLIFIWQELEDTM